MHAWIRKSHRRSRVRELIRWLLLFIQLELLRVRENRAHNLGGELRQRVVELGGHQIYTLEDLQLRSQYLERVIQTKPNGEVDTCM